MAPSADPTQKRRGRTMRARQVAVASVLVVVLSSLAGPTVRAQGGATLAHCKADAEKICPGVTPGGGKLIECLKQHTDDVSVGCAKALKAVKAKMGK
jgi:Cysteine rich repeat